MVSVHSGKCGFSGAQSSLTQDPAGRGGAKRSGAGQEHFPVIDTCGLLREAGNAKVER